jgi:hypothetical protein
VRVRRVVRPLPRTTPRGRRRVRAVARQNPAATADLQHRGGLRLCERASTLRPLWPEPAREGQPAPRPHVHFTVRLPARARKCSVVPSRPGSCPALAYDEAPCGTNKIRGFCISAFGSLPSRDRSQFRAVLPGAKPCHLASLSAPPSLRGTADGAWALARGRSN